MTTSSEDPSIRRKNAESRLAQMEDRYYGLLEAAPDAMVVVNQQGEIILLNLQAEKQFGYPRDELLGQKITTIIPEGFAERLVADDLRTTAEALAQQIGTGIELTARRKDGGEFPIEIMLSPLETADDLLVTAAIRDISLRRAAEKKIIYLNRIYAMLSAINTLIVRARDHDELFMEVCRIGVNSGGFSQAWIGKVDPEGSRINLVASAGIDQKHAAIINERYLLSEDAPSGNSMVARAIREKTYIVSNNSQNDSQVLFADEYPESSANSIVILPLIIENKADGVLALYSDETGYFDDIEMKLLIEVAGDISFAIDHIDKRDQLSFLAYYDVLTGLANRKLFLERAAQYMRTANYEGHKLALYLFDIEGFKNINDSLGQASGDLLLQQVAKWLTDQIGDTHMLARIDADHFAAVQPIVRHEGEVARLIRKSMAAFQEHTFHAGKTELRIAAKVGVAVFPDDAANADELLKKAEAALKKAKDSGDRYLFYTEKMTSMVAERLALETQLRNAFDKEEFELHYQPKVNLLTGVITGVEALIRWNHPQKGLISPGQFIPILEETGLICDVGRWALRKALDDHLRWRSAGLPALRIAVNVSQLQLRDTAFIADMEQTLAIDAEAASGLELELTESLIMTDIKYSVDTLLAIRTMGVTIAIDDFGTGFSSLSYLSKLPLDTLKIDCMFINEMTLTPAGQVLVHTIISLGHLLNLKVVAEGVETEEQLLLLKSLGCDEMQGFLHSEPVPREILETRYLGSESDESPRT
ncbi:MAG: EAL domain-containing protein [Gammaproteobacteria bacterium]